MKPEKFQKITRKSYDSISRQFSKSRKYVWSDLEVFLPYIKKGDKVLDLGCGNGRLIDLLKDKKIKYLGVDNSRGLIKQAKEYHSKEKFKVKNALNLNYKNEFDVIISSAVFNHMPDSNSRRQFLQNIYRALKPGGYFLMNNWNMWNSTRKKGYENFIKEKETLNDKAFFQKFNIQKSEIQKGDVLTEWGKGDILYYYAFIPLELKDLLQKAKFKILKNYYSFDGQQSTKFKARNIITMAQK